MSPRELSNTWRLKAEELRELGADPQAQALKWCVDELETMWRAWELEVLPLQQAAYESGQSPCPPGARGAPSTVQLSASGASPGVTKTREAPGDPRSHTGA